MKNLYPPFALSGTLWRPHWHLLFSHPWLLVWLVGISSRYQCVSSPAHLLHPFLLDDTQFWDILTPIEFAISQLDIAWFCSIDAYDMSSPMFSVVSFVWPISRDDRGQTTAAEIVVSQRNDDDFVRLHKQQPHGQQPDGPLHFAAAQAWTVFSPLLVASVTDRIRLKTVPGTWRLEARRRLLPVPSPGDVLCCAVKQRWRQHAFAVAQRSSKDVANSWNEVNLQLCRQHECPIQNIAVFQCLRTRASIKNWRRLPTAERHGTKNLVLVSNRFLFFCDFFNHLYAISSFEKKNDV